jgi:hypothetical protein
MHNSLEKSNINICSYLTVTGENAGVCGIWNYSVKHKLWELYCQIWNTEEWVSCKLNNSENNYFKCEHGSGNHLYGARKSHIVPAIVGYSYYTRFLLYL